MPWQPATPPAGVLTVIGDLVEDIVVWPCADVRAGTDNTATIHRARGGSAANVAVSAAATVPTRFIGRVGADATGDDLTAGLVRLGVDVRVQRRGRTGTVVAIVDASGERTMYPDRAAAAELDDVDADWLAGTSVLHVPAYGFQQPSAAAAIRSAIDAVRRAGALVSVDASATSLIEDLGTATFGQLLAAIAPDVLFANADEARLLGLASSERAVAATICVIKDGPRDAVVRGPGGELVRSAPPPVTDVRDTIGAGDAFAGGFLAAWMTGHPFSAALHAAHEAAAHVLTVPGAGDGTRGGTR